MLFRLHKLDLWTAWQEKPYSPPHLAMREWDEILNHRGRRFELLYLYACKNALERQEVSNVRGENKYPENVHEPQIAQRWDGWKVPKGADEVGVRLQARSGHRCGRRVKLSSHYHADTQADNGGSICSCQPLQIWCQPVHWRQQATASNHTAQAPPACKSSHRLHTHSLSC